jgi:CRISPR system Cascade subunit CasE
VSYLSQVVFSPQNRDDHGLANRMLVAPYLQHQTLWTLFAKPAGTAQPFLFRQMLDARVPKFLLLSDEPPSVPSASWRVQSKLFVPTFRPGQVLAFQARLNPTRSERRPGDQRGKRQDLLMSLLHQVPAERRATERQRLLHERLPQWFADRGSVGGFKVVEESGNLQCAISRYEIIQSAVRQDGTERKVTLGCADFSGRLEVTDPDRLNACLRRGIGHGKAFGLGLLLVRPA